MKYVPAHAVATNKIHEYQNVHHLLSSHSSLATTLLALFRPVGSEPLLFYSLIVFQSLSRAAHDHDQVSLNLLAIAIGPWFAIDVTWALHAEAGIKIYLPFSSHLELKDPSGHGLYNRATKKRPRRPAAGLGYRSDAGQLEYTY